MATKVRKTGGRTELTALWGAVNRLMVYLMFSVRHVLPVIDDGTTAGKLKTTNSAAFYVAGLTYTKAGTDDLWDLSAETDTTATQFRAYWLYVNAAGTASFAASVNAPSAAAALNSLPAIDVAKSVFGVFVAGVSTDFDDAGGLAAQGTLYDGIPAGVLGIGVTDFTELVAP